MRVEPLTHFRQPLRQTAFHARTAALNVRNDWGAWAGYTSPQVLDDAVMEYTAIRNSASVYDLCPMVKYRIEGPDAARYLDRLTVRNVASMPTGSVHYTVWCDDNGKIIDDGTLFRRAGQTFRLCCQERHLPWLLDSGLGYDVRITDETDDVAALSLQGPCSAEVLRLAGADVSALRPFRIAGATIADRPVTLSRTGFTGDLGYELWMDPADALSVWDRLFEAGAGFGLRAIGSEALNLARIEAGFIIANMDFVPSFQAVREDRARSPVEMGLGWLIDWRKGHFNGRRALIAERDGGTSRWSFVGLDIPGNVSAESSLLYAGKTKEAGFITAAAWSPATKRNIAMAHVETRFARSDLWVEIYAPRELQYVKLMLPARIVPRPFFVHPRRRATPPGRF